MFGRAVDALDSEGPDRRTDGGREVFSAVYSDYYRDLIEALVDRRRQTEASRSGTLACAALLTMIADATCRFPPASPPGSNRSGIARTPNTTRRSGSSDLESKQHRRRQELLERRAALRDRRAETSRRSRRLAAVGVAPLSAALSLDGTRAALDPGTLLLRLLGRQGALVLFAVEPAGAKGAGLTVFALPPTTDRSVGRRGAAATSRLSRSCGSGCRSRSPPARGNSTKSSCGRPRSLIAGYERLLILPDGPLHTLPWAALRPRRDEGAAPLSRRVEAHPHRDLGHRVCRAEKGPAPATPGNGGYGRGVRRSEVSEAPREEGRRATRRGRHGSVDRMSGDVILEARLRQGPSAARAGSVSNRCRKPAGKSARSRRSSRRSPRLISVSTRPKSGPRRSARTCP